METKDIAINTSFWEILYADTKDFEEPVLYENFFEEPLLKEEEVRNILINWTKQSYNDAVVGIDMTVKGEKRNRYDQLMYKLPFQSNKTIEELYNELVGNKKASILVKSPEQYYEPLAKRVAKFLEPLINKFGLPQFTWTTALIIGNYNYTPFGVHFDAGNQRAFHTMIGKGKKKMWVWKRDLVDEIMRSSGLNSVRCYSENEVHKLTSHGKCHLIEENDFYFLPNHHYHIAYVEEFTIGLAIAIDRRDQNDLVRGAIQNFLSQNITENLHFSSFPFQRDNIDYMNLKEAEQHMSKAGWLTDGVKGEILMSKSNQGMGVPPQVKEILHEDLSNITVKINAPFPIKWLVNKNDLEIYVRSRVIPLSFSDLQEETLSLISILERLNNGEELKFSTIAALLDDEMEQEDIAYLTKLFYHYGGVLFE